MNIPTKIAFSLFVIVLGAIIYGVISALIGHGQYLWVFVEFLIWVFVEFLIIVYIWTRPGKSLIRWLIVASVFLVLLATVLTFSVPQFIPLFEECELPTLTKLTFDAYGVVWIFPLITAGLTIDALRRTVISAHYRLRAIRCLWLVMMLELVFVAAAVTSIYWALCPFSIM